MKQIKLIEVKSEIGAGTRGASMGIDALKIAALDFCSYFFKNNKSVTIPVENDLLLEPAKNEYAKRIGGLYKVVEKLAKEVKKTLETPNTFPIVLLGDHSSAIGTVAGIKMAYPDKRLGVIWIDAHADIHSPYTTELGNMHGMPIAAMLGIDNLESKINNPDKEAIEYWGKLKSLGGIKPKILPSDIIYVAARDIEKEETAAIKRLKIHNYTVAEIREKGMQRSAVEVLNHLDKCDIIHISFDVDSMDPSISRGTGTPVKNGLTEREVGSLISRFLYSKKIVSFEITEINPTLDKENFMAENAFEILQRAANHIIQG